MVWIDDLMREKPANPYSYKDAEKRPHQLFLGGDQIYADDVGRCHMHMLIDLSKRLIGDHPAEALENVGEALELLPVDSIRRKKQGVTQPSKFDDYEAPLKPGAPDTKATDFMLPADHAWFPSGRRYLQSIVDAQMTSIDGTSHLFAFGEFAAMYLSVWSNACLDSASRPPRCAVPRPADGEGRAGEREVARCHLHLRRHAAQHGGNPRRARAR